VPVGTAKFVLEAPPPSWERLPAHEIRGVTVVLVTCSYNGAEFVRIGYYVNNDFTDPQLRENPPDVFVPTTMVPALQRHILDSKPRVTRCGARFLT
jgi:histone chaperone ASF1